MNLSLILRMLLISATSSFGCLYSICIFQIMFFTRGSSGSHDFGLATLVPSWILAIAWSRYSSFSMARRLLGWESMAGFLWGGPLSIFVSLVSSYVLMFSLNDADIQKYSEYLFWILSIGGLIPEGRSGTGPGLALFWFNILAGTFFGLNITFWRRIRTQPRIVEPRED